jgi:hypothetical protein
MFIQRANTLLVPEAGLEPAHHLWRRILSPVRLPIPPLRPAGESVQAT